MLRIEAMTLCDIKLYVLLLAWVVAAWNIHQRGRTIKSLLLSNQQLRELLLSQRRASCQEQAQHQQREP
jgi:hypothetical protein